MCDTDLVYCWEIERERESPAVLDIWVLSLFKCSKEFRRHRKSYKGRHRPTKGPRTVSGDNLGRVDLEQSVDQG